MRFSSIIGVVALGLVVSGCNSTQTVDTRRPPTPLPSTPTEPVETAELSPLDPEVQVAGEPNPNKELESEAPTSPIIEEKSASIEDAPKPSGEKVTREGMAGSWNVPSDNAECRIILAFTKWSGGYRAATRRCQSTEIAAVTAWDVKGQQVVLVDGSGGTVARLFSSGGSRYDGSLNSGGKITFTR